MEGELMNVSKVATSSIFPKLDKQCPNPKKNPRCRGTTLLGGLCRSCSHFGHKDSLETTKRRSEVMRGERNPFYGRNHTKETIEKIRLFHLGRRSSEETKKKLSLATSGKKNPMHGKTHSDDARRKIGETHRGKKDSEETRRKKSLVMRGNKNPFYGKKHTNRAKKKMSEAGVGRVCSEESRRKMSESRKGKKNNMYGKPSPVGGSNGIGGWFKSVYFRSSCELRFLMIHQEIEWKSAENKDYAVKYMDENGLEKTCFPDFVGNGFLIEVKPLGWHRNPVWRNVLIKARATADFCENGGLEYVRVEIRDMSRESVFKLRDQKKIKLNRKWERLYTKSRESFV